MYLIKIGKLYIVKDIFFEFLFMKKKIFEYLYKNF